LKSSVTIEELKKVKALRELPDEHLEWLLTHSEYVEYEDGDVLYETGEPIDWMGFLLEGRIYFYLNVNGKLVFYFSFENDDLSGGVTGLLPYSRMRSSPGKSCAVGKLRIIKLHKKYFLELEKLNPDFIQRLIGYMTERARAFATTQLQQEKVSALGKLAAGIAHEMNNPAAAINRISDELDKKLKQNFELTEELLNHNIAPELIKNIRELARNNDNIHSSESKISPLQRMQKEDELNDWLSKKCPLSSNEMSETFAEAGFSPDELEKITADVPPDAFQNIMDWFENLISSELLIKDLNNASERITLLVGAIKSHVRMDRSDDIHKTNIHEDLENTLILLGYKLRDKNIQVRKKFCDDMTEVDAYIGELNQVWTNIIDNAIHALPQDGELEIETECNNNDITIRITDNGTGIPEEIISRVFDPFFTTKKVGEGTGIGLDIVKNVITRHNGDVKVNSMPGKTEFTIRIPVSQNLTNKDSQDETSIHNNN